MKITKGRKIMITITSLVVLVVTIASVEMLSITKESKNIGCEAKVPPVKVVSTEPVVKTPMSEEEAKIVESLSVIDEAAIDVELISRSEEHPVLPEKPAPVVVVEVEKPEVKVVSKPVAKPATNPSQPAQSVENKTQSRAVSLTLAEAKSMKDSGQNFTLVMSMTYCPYCLNLKEQIKANYSGYVIYFLEIDLVDQDALRERYPNASGPLVAIQEDLGIPTGIAQTPMPINFRGGSVSVPSFSGNLSSLIGIMKR